MATFFFDRRISPYYRPIITNIKEGDILQTNGWKLLLLVERVVDGTAYVRKCNRRGPYGEEIRLEINAEQEVWYYTYCFYPARDFRRR